MANKDKKNVKRFIEDLSVEAANDAYNGGSGTNVIEVEDITALTTEQCNSLKAGDEVLKLTSNQKHTYVVSYKEDEVGMCLTYTDASVVETVSYDYVDNAWVYNSTDVTELSQGGGVTPVDTLPDVGNVSTLYKLPDGKIYSYSEKQVQRKVCDLVAGQSFTMVDTIKAKDVLDISNVILSDDDEVVIRFNDLENSPAMIFRYDSVEVGTKITIGYISDISLESPLPGAYYEYSYEDFNPNEIINISLEGITEIPNVTITEHFIDQLLTNTEATIEILEPVFVNSYHYEYDTVGVYSQVGFTSLQRQPIQNVCRIIVNTILEHETLTALDITKFYELLVKYNFDLTTILDQANIDVVLVGNFDNLGTRNNIISLTSGFHIYFSSDSTGGVDTLMLNISDYSFQYEDAIEISTTLTTDDTLQDLFDYMIENEINIPLAQENESNEISTVFDVVYYLPNFDAYKYSPNYATCILSDAQILTENFYTFIDANDVVDCIIEANITSDTQDDNEE